MAACPATHAHALGDPCLRPEHQLARAAFQVREVDILEAEHAAIQRVTENTFARALEHLTLGPETWEAEGRRGVWLWGLLNISVAQDGTDFRIDYLGREPADEAQPISPLGFVAALAPILAAEARGCELPLETLSGPTGDHIRRVLVRTLYPCVSWHRLRGAVAAYLRLRAPHVHEVSRDRRRGRHLGAHEVRASTRSLSPFEIAIRRRSAPLPRLQLVVVHGEAH